MDYFKYLYICLNCRDLWLISSKDEQLLEQLFYNVHNVTIKIIQMRLEDQYTTLNRYKAWGIVKLIVIIP